jgi:hypothetical protein
MFLEFGLYAGLSYYKHLESRIFQNLICCNVEFARYNNNDEGH